VFAYDVVIPTIGRPNLATLLGALTSARGPTPASVTVVDDRPRGEPLRPKVTAELAEALLIMRGFGRGPAAARNIGWRCGSAAWVVFLDDDVLITPRWAHALEADLDVELDVAAVQGHVMVPAPLDRKPTDWERSVRGLEGANWITADMAVRRDALEDVGGFDERFPRAYREDADLALRLLDRGWRLARGGRLTLHPAAQASPWVSLRAQAGNADDVVMTALHGPDWRERAGAPRGCFTQHAITVGAAAAAVTATVVRRRRIATLAAAVWAGALARFSWARIAPGPRTPREVATMVATSALIPPLAVLHRLRGHWRVRREHITNIHRVSLGRGRRSAGTAIPRHIDAVFFDRDGTLTFDVPYNGDPDRVRVVPGAADAVRRLRAAGVHVAGVSNQSGVALGLLSPAQVRAVNQRIESELGRFDGWFCCLHAPDDACGCRKPEPGLVQEAARSLDLDPSCCVVVGDIGADVDAAARAGAVGILVPTPRTDRAEVERAPLVAATITDAVDLVLGARGR
jgi:histidinol-phosphate phosphatase family protein